MRFVAHCALAATEVMEPLEQNGKGAEAATSAPVQAPDPALTDVPRSMHEIYEISNKNRKRNKEKRKLKEDSKEVSNEPFSPVKFSASDESFDGSENDATQGQHPHSLVTGPQNRICISVFLPQMATPRSKS